MSGITISHLPQTGKQNEARRYDYNGDGMLSGKELKDYERAGSDINRSISKGITRAGGSVWGIRESDSDGGESKTTIVKRPNGRVTVTHVDSEDGIPRYIANEEYDENGVKRSSARTHTGDRTEVDRYDENGDRTTTGTLDYEG